LLLLGPVASAGRLLLPAVRQAAAAVSTTSIQQHITLPLTALQISHAVLAVHLVALTVQ
jgi:hypothetical protein